MSNLVRPRGKVSIKEMRKVIEDNNWYWYISEAKDWAEEHDRDLRIEQRADKDTRGFPRKYYDAKVLLDYWQDTKQDQALPGGLKYYRRVKHRFERFAEEK
jgi:hypothetical protein